MVWPFFGYGGHADILWMIHASSHVNIEDVLQVFGDSWRIHSCSGVIVSILSKARSGRTKYEQSEHI
jgi:hypothetical protein